MKSARERAEEIAELFAPHAGWAFSPLAERIEASFKRHAGDQREMCRQAVHALEPGNESPEAAAYMRADALDAVVGAPVPGGQR